MKENYAIYKDTNPGLYSKFNYDSILINEAKDKILLGVFSGIGKNSGASFASSTLERCLSLWFDSLISDLDVMEIRSSLIRKLNKINNKLMLLNDCKCSVALAFILEQESIITNIGNSRIYTYDGILKQISIDDDNFSLNKEYKRYISDSVITTYIGCNKLNIHTSIINNNYDKLLLCTNGITRCLSDKRIESIIRKNNIDFANKLVYDSLYIKDNNYKKEAYQALITNGYKFKDVSVGAYNTSAIVYKKLK